MKAKTKPTTHRENNSAICCTAPLGPEQPDSPWPAHTRHSNAQAYTARTGHNSMQNASPASSKQQQASLQLEGNPTAVLMATRSCTVGDSLWFAWKSKRQQDGEAEQNKRVSQSPLSDRNV